MAFSNGRFCRAKIAAQINDSKSGVNGFMKAFGKAEKASFPFPAGITNNGIFTLVYGGSDCYFYRW